MGGRLYVFPIELLNLWQFSHGMLTPELRKEFITRPICLEIGRYPRPSVANAVRRRKKLTAVLDELREGVAAAPPADPLPSWSEVKAADATKLSKFPTGEVRKRMTRKQKWKAADDRLDNPSDAERILWERLRNRQLDGYFFLREFAIKAWWADFYCAAGKLVIEVDGVHHLERRDNDAERDQVMRAAGYQVLRFPAIRVYLDIDALVNEIKAALDTPRARAHRKASQRSARKKKVTPKTVTRPTKKKAPAKKPARVPHKLYRCSMCGKVYPQTAGGPTFCPKCRSQGTAI